MSVSTSENDSDTTLLDSISPDALTPFDMLNSGATATPVSSRWLTFFMWGVGLLALLLITSLAIFNWTTVSNLFNRELSTNFDFLIITIMLVTALICNYALFKVPSNVWLTTSMIIYFAAFLIFDYLPAALIVGLPALYVEFFVLRRGSMFAVRTAGMYILAVTGARFIFTTIGGSPIVGDITLEYFLAVIAGFIAFRAINEGVVSVTLLLQGYGFAKPFIERFLSTNLPYLAMLPVSIILAILKFGTGPVAFVLTCTLVISMGLLLKNFTLIGQNSQEQLTQVQKLNASLARQYERQVALGNRINETLDSFLTLIRTYAATSHEQEAAVVEITATVEELSRTATQIASSADEVTVDADRAIETTAHGQEAVTDTIEAIREVRFKMQEIAASILNLYEKSEQIGKIVTTINAIAGEIRLLALNATIEASGAGQYGRRFAVVAGEVSELADRSRKAVLEIRNIISEIQLATSSTVHITEDGLQQMERTVAAVAQSETSNNQIIVVVEKTAQAAAAISQATQQQRSASEQVVTSMHDVAIMIGQNAEKVASLSVASLELQRVARELKEAQDL